MTYGDHTILNKLHMSLILLTGISKYIFNIFLCFLKEEREKDIENSCTYRQ